MPITFVDGKNYKDIDTALDTYLSEWAADRAVPPTYLIKAEMGKVWDEYQARKAAR